MLSPPQAFLMLVVAGMTLALPADYYSQDNYVSAQPASCYKF